jgi:hypothetical protein
MYKHYNDDNEIESLLQKTSSVFSPSKSHFKKILSTIDIDSSLEPRKSTTIARSPYLSFVIHHTRVLGASFVFVVALFSARTYIMDMDSATLTQLGDTQNAELVAPYTTPTTDDVSALAMNTSPSPATFMVEPAQNNSTANLRTAKTSVPLKTDEEQSLGKSLSQELTADQLAADDLVAISE